MNTVENTALLVMDMQNMIVQRLPSTASICEKVAGAITKARAAGIKVIYVRVCFRPGAPEISANNKSFSNPAFKDQFSEEKSAAWKTIHESVSPMPNEIIVDKRRVSAFSGSDLEVILRANGIKHIVLTGIATSGVVLSTLREAADKDYGITVLADCCADADEEVHRVLTTKVFVRQANVINLEEWNN
jgi:nicotinamidase-related amidase